MTTDAWQCLVGIVSVGLLTAGAWLEFGRGYGLMTLGGLLLSGIVYARTRVTEASDEDINQQV